jgi:hypothetical protein
MIVMLLAPHYVAITTLISVILVMLMYIYLDGCFLSSLEYKINKSDITIADPLIMIFGDDITHNNRFWYSIITIILYVIIAICVTYYRFFI